MKRLKMKMADPLFAPGEAKVAIATLPVKPADLACSAELWLSKDGTSVDATSGVVAFTSTGIEQSINLPIVMPSVAGYSYQVLLDIRVEGVLIMAFRADEDVIVPWVGTPIITW